MRIAVIGSGYVGLVSGACFSEFGFEVVCVDQDAGKIAQLNAGRIPIYEPELDNLVKNNVARRLAAQVEAGALSAQEIDEAAFGAHLSTVGLPDPDLMIRTSGEQRVSNFLLWQLAYAEMMFVEKYWPDFTGEDLNAALAEFRRRDRRFGAVISDVLPGAVHQR